MSKHGSTASSDRLRHAIQTLLGQASDSTTAKALHKQLSSSFQGLEKRDVNRVLHEIKKLGLVKQHDDYSWAVSTTTSVQPKDSERKSAATESDRARVHVQPTVLTEQQNAIVEFQPSGHLLVRGEAGSGKTYWVDR